MGAKVEEREDGLLIEGETTYGVVSGQLEGPSSPWHWPSPPLSALPQSSFEIVMRWINPIRDFGGTLLS